MEEPAAAAGREGVVTIVDAMSDAKLFGPWFSGESWETWKAVLRAVFGLSMQGGDWEVYGELTRRESLPANLRELWLVAGRRSGKSILSALIATWVACFKDWAGILKKGERGVVMLLASDRAQAKVIFDYLKGFMEGVTMLASMVELVRQQDILLRNRVSIEIHTSSYRSIRGRTVLAAVCDELSFWQFEDSSANPDKEVLAALRPSLATVPGSLLICVSTPYARRGELWRAYDRYFGCEDSGRLVVQGASRTFNPTIAETVVSEALAEDPAAAGAEWLGEFRRDIESYISVESVEQCIVPGRVELLAAEGTSYRAFVDPAGGSGTDSMTLAIGHQQGETVVLDALRERKPPFSPEQVVGEFSALLKSYRISEVHGDRYAGSWPAEGFSKCGITYRAAEKTKSELYQEMLPKLNSKRVELLDHGRLKGQLQGLERRTGRGGRDSIDHAPNAHDDLANVLAGVVSLCGKQSGWFIWQPRGPEEMDHFSQSLIMMRNNRKEG